MACTFLNPTRFVPPNYPGVAELRQQGCPVKAFRSPRIDYTREFFCSKWSPSFRCVCAQKCVHPCGTVHGPSQFRGVGNEVQSFDYFTALPLRPEGRYTGIKDPPTLAQRAGLVKKNPCPKRELGFSTTCKSLGRRMQPEFFKDDTVCGTCVPNPKSREPFVCDDFPGYDISSNLPFRVCIGEYPPEPKPIRIRSGAERCLQPSNYRDINSVYRENFTDFIKAKTRKQISLYRSPLAIDKRRPRPKIPCDTNPNLVIGVNNGPLIVNAKAIKFQTCNKVRRPPCLPPIPDFKVILPPGPIVVPY